MGEVFPLFIFAREVSKRVTIEVALLISIISVAFSVWGSIRGNKRADTSDIEKRATEQATLIAKLDNIAGDVKDIKTEVSTVKRDVQILTERVVLVENSTKSAHRRLDEIMHKQPREEAL